MNHTGWIETASGIKFDLLDPQPEMVCAYDIAHALSKLCRFGGHCRQFYSVAEHSRHVYDVIGIDAFQSDPDNLPRESLMLAALLHDASEAYCVDVPRPLKGILDGYKEIEHRIQCAIAAAFGFNPEEFDDPLIEDADRRMLSLEASELMPSKGTLWSTRVTPADVRLGMWEPRVAAQIFMDTLDNLLGSQTAVAAAKGTNGCA